MSMKDLLQKNHPSQISQGKCSPLDSKTHSLNTDGGGSSKDSSKRPVSKHSQRKWRFFNMVKFVQKVKPPFLGANKKTASTTNHSKDSYQFSVESDQTSSNTSSPIKLPTNQLKSPFETGAAVKLNGFTMGDSTFCEYKTRDLDSSETSTGFDGKSTTLDSDTIPTISGKRSSVLGSKGEMLSSYEEILSDDDEVTDQLVEFEESLHDYFANDSSSFEGLDAYIQFAKEYHDEVSS